MIYVILLTYASSIDSPRSEYARITLESALNNLKSSQEIKFHIADDGSDPEHVDCLVNLCKTYDREYSVTNAERRGYGASYNLATQQCHWDGDYFLMLEDDWKLIKELNLDDLVEGLDDGLNCIRMGYLGWTSPLRGTFMKYGQATYLEIDPESDETHVWSGHPRLETKSFQRDMGPWPEGVDPGTTEFIVSQRKESRQKVAWPLDFGINASQQWANCWAHIGAVQARADQVQMKAD